MNKLIEGNEDSKWKDLYKIGGITAIIAAVLLLIEIIVFTIWPQPTTVNEYQILFLYQHHQIIGLFYMNVLQVVSYILFVPTFLAIYIALKRFNESYMAIAIILAIIGIAIFLANNNAFPAFCLSNLYDAGDLIQKSDISWAMYNTLANTSQPALGGFNMGFLLVTFAGLIYSYVMLGSNIFSKKIAFLGILTFAIALTDYFRVILKPMEPILLLITTTSTILLIIWLIVIGRRLLQLRKTVLEKEII